ncbi:HalOD1 output domain-containing protein [Natronorarus salvus]|uniref:HalOD1 output domain-containing protein n=1 Tax=Natronorarus salvus TaxID=3117733 RepID=UPI002F261617
MSTITAEVADESYITQAVIGSIAEAEGTDPLELTPPLYEVIDLSALESLFTDGKTLGKVVFNYNDYEVSVFSDGYISVENNGV